MGNLITYDGINNNYVKDTKYVQRSHGRRPHRGDPFWSNLVGGISRSFDPRAS